jgi:hypothetical protein
MARRHADPKYREQEQIANTNQIRLEHTDPEYRVRHHHGKSSNNNSVRFLAAADNDNGITASSGMKKKHDGFKLLS